MLPFCRSLHFVWHFCFLLVRCWHFVCEFAECIHHTHAQGKHKQPSPSNRMKGEWMSDFCTCRFLDYKLFLCYVSCVHVLPYCMFCMLFKLYCLLFYCYASSNILWYRRAPTYSIHSLNHSVPRIFIGLIVIVFIVSFANFWMIWCENLTYRGGKSKHFTSDIPSHNFLDTVEYLVCTIVCTSLVLLLFSLHNFSSKSLF